jgi:hypothetical protein
MSYPNNLLGTSLILIYLQSLFFSFTDVESYIFEAGIRMVFSAGSSVYILDIDLYRRMNICSPMEVIEGIFFGMKDGLEKF